MRPAPASLPRRLAESAGGTPIAMPFHEKAGLCDLQKGHSDRGDLSGVGNHSHFDSMVVGGEDPENTGPCMD
jgi:hypothetical protein